jgi:hypothetical protein
VEEAKEVKEIEEKSADLTGAGLTEERPQEGSQLRGDADSWRGYAQTEVCATWRPVLPK